MKTKLTKKNKQLREIIVIKDETIEDLELSLIAQEYVQMYFNKAIYIEKD